MRGYYSAITRWLDGDDGGHRRRGKEIREFELPINAQPMGYELNF